MLIAFITGVLFAIHPIHIESVAWITSRKDLLFVFFFLLSVVFYIGYSEKSQNLFRYLLVIVCVIFALLSKIQAVSLPFIFLLVDYYYGKELKAKLLLEKLPFFLLCLFFGWVNFIAQKEYGYIAYGYQYSNPEKGIIFIYSISQYFIKVLIPYPLSVFYPYPFEPGEPVPLSILAVPLIFITLVAILIYLSRNEKKHIIFGLLFFLFNSIIVTTVSFHRDAVIADRYAYISSAGIFFIIAFVASFVISKYRKLRIPVICTLLAIIIGYSIVTFRRSMLWREPVKLFSNALSFYNDSDIILNTLAAQEIESGKFGEAIVHLDKAILISPSYSEAYFNRGIAQSKTGNFAASINDLSAAITLNPAYDEAYFARGNSYMKSNELDNAIHDFSTTIRLNPNHFGAFQNRAIVKGNLEDYTSAIEDLNAAIVLNPGFASTYYLRGIALFNTGGNGCADLEKSLSMGYKDAGRAIEYYCK